MWIALRQRPSMSLNTSIENSSPRHISWTKERAVKAQEEVELLRVVRPIDVARAEALACLHQHRVARVVGDVLGQPAPRRRDPVLDEEPVCLELVGHARAIVGIGEEQEYAGASSSRARESTGWSRSFSGTIRRTSCSRMSAASAGTKPGSAYPRDDRLAIGVVERRRERVGVGAENIRAGSLEGPDDVDALARAGEEDDHERRAYPEGPRKSLLQSDVNVAVTSIT